MTKSKFFKIAAGQTTSGLRSPVTSFLFVGGGKPVTTPPTLMSATFTFGTPPKEGNYMCGCAAMTTIDFFKSAQPHIMRYTTAHSISNIFAIFMNKSAFFPMLIAR